LNSHTHYYLLFALPLSTPTLILHSFPTRRSSDLELMLLKQFNLPVKVIIMNNSALGMVRQWQESFYEERYSQSLLDTNPDFVKLADSYGVKGMKVEHEADVDSAIEEMLAYDGPILVDFRIIKKEKVYPMIAPGKGIHQMVGVTK